MPATLTAESAAKRAEFIEEYKVDDHGRIGRPGKFECEMFYMPFAYDAYCEGFYDEEGDSGVVVDFPAEVRDWFPGYEDVDEVRFYVDDNGFVNEV